MSQSNGPNDFQWRANCSCGFLSATPNSKSRNNPKNCSKEFQSKLARDPKMAPKIAAFLSFFCISFIIIIHHRPTISIIISSSCTNRSRCAWKPPSVLVKKKPEDSKLGPTRGSGLVYMQLMVSCFFPPPPPQPMDGWTLTPTDLAKKRVSWIFLPYALSLFTAPSNAIHHQPPRPRQRDPVDRLARLTLRL